MKKEAKIILPGQPGFNDPRLPWGGVRNALGMKKPDKVSLEIHGFYLVDHRMKPPIAIFKNCQFPMQAGTRPMLKDPPQPFQYLGDALDRKKKMHLSMADERLVRPTAMVPDPGMGAPKPDVVWLSREEAHDR
jgi:hypothetical protein